MAYQIVHANGDLFTSIGDGVVDNSIGLSLIGKNYHNYGELIANNFLHLLENQASSVPPQNPQEGQLWWDKRIKVLNFFDGNRFKPCSSSAVGIDAPIKPLDGDQWWNTDRHQLMVFNGTSWLVVGPIYAKGQGQTGTSIETTTDINSQLHTIAAIKVDGETIAVVSNDDKFISSSPVSGISTIAKGISLAPGTIMLGTADNALNLNGVPAAGYLRTDANNSINGSLTVTGGPVTVINATTPGSYIRTFSDVSSQSISTSHNLTITSGNSVVTFNSLTGEATLNTQPTSNSGIPTKLYVDNAVLNSRQNATTYIDTRIQTLVGNASVTTISALSRAIDNDANFSINTKAAIDSKAPINSPTFTGNAKIMIDPTSPTGIASKRYVDNAVATLSSSFIPTNIPNSALNNSFIQIGSALISLGSSVSSLNGLSSIDATNVISTTVIANTFQGNVAGSLVGKATLSSGSTAVTPILSSNSTDLATTEFVTRAVAAAVAAVTAPPGMIGYFVTTTPPSGWIVADGTYVLIATYPQLFAVIGYRYGLSTVVGSFCLPDLRTNDLLACIKF